MKKIISKIQAARLKIARSVDSRVKTAYAILSLARIKKAYSKRDIQRGVAQHFKSEGLERIPDIDWGEVFEAPVRRLAGKYKWSKTHTEDVMASILQDFISGMNLDTGGKWKDGNLAQRVRNLYEMGKDDKDIKYMLMNVVSRKAQTKSFKIKDGPKDSDMRSLQPGRGGGEEVTNLVEDIFSLDPVSKGQAGMWMSLSQRDPVLRDLLRKIDKIIKQNARGKYKNLPLFWEVFKNNPDLSMRELGQMPVTVKNPDTGRPETMTLHQATHPNSKSGHAMYADFQKLQDLLENMKPVVMEALQEAG